MPEQKKRPIKRTTYKVDFNEFIRFGNKMIKYVGHPSVVDIIRSCVVAQKGNEKRAITREEAAKLLKK